ncbi:SDR family NAD(P)-dependent oxidoreductase [uncultured Enterovirga sp.]|uniref:SDR family NAD(P)-dependent oxidoreductase n=1 Tax=uncultured Enterovirga sp. TaxID=2026352 RepID=UPI0035CC3A8A
MGQRLAGKAAIVTGGAGGIGSAVGQVFCEEGARIVLVDRDAEAMESVVGRIRESVPGAEVVPFLADLGQEESAAEIVAEAQRAFGRLDILVNNAGIRSYERLAEAKSETWRQILAVNLLSYAYLAREALPYLRAARGAIVNVSSTHAFNPRAGMGQYDVTKAGIVSMTRTLAFEETRNGVRVNAVCPGLTFTPFHDRRAKAAGRSHADLDAEAEATCLMGRWADTREIAIPIVWLASDEASYITGESLMVDGGRLVV